MQQSRGACDFFPIAERLWRGAVGRGHPKEPRDEPRSVRSHGKATAKVHTRFSHFSYASAGHHEIAQDARFSDTPAKSADMQQSRGACDFFPIAERLWRGAVGRGHPKEPRDEPLSVRSHGPATAKAHTPFPSSVTRLFTLRHIFVTFVQIFYSLVFLRIASYCNNPVIVLTHINAILNYLDNSILRIFVSSNDKQTFTTN